MREGIAKKVVGAFCGALILTIGTAHASTIISQIYGGGGSTSATPLYSNDWVLLYNDGATAQDLSGWSLQYASATNATTFGSGTTVFHALSGVIAANSYFLVQEGRGSPVGNAGSLADPIYDLTGGGINLSSSAGKIALFSSISSGASTTAVSTYLQDLVGYGTTANFSLYPTMTANLSLTTAAIRTLDAGGNTVFVAGTPNPNPVPTPIPGAVVLLGSGLAGLARLRRRIG